MVTVAVVVVSMAGVRMTLGAVQCLRLRNTAAVEVAWERVGRHQRPRIIVRLQAALTPRQAARQTHKFNVRDRLAVAAAAMAAMPEHNTTNCDQRTCVRARRRSA